MKILHYIPSLDFSSGGPATSIQTLSKELGKSVELHIVTHFSEQMALVENAQIHYLSNSLVQLRQIKKQWLQLLKAIQPDVVQVNCCWIPLCAFTQKWAQRAGYKVVLTPRGMLEPWILQRHYWTRKLPALWLYQKNAIKNADCIHATAESEKENILRLKYNNNIVVVPNGIEVKNIAIKSDWTKTKTILYLSRIHPKKGIELLIDTVERIKDVLSGYKFIIAGEGEADYIRSLQNRIQEKELQSFFDFVGGVYGDAKWDLYHQADVFILPTYSENFGNVVVEALACGTPVITTTGTPWQELETHRCGWWIDNGVSTIAKTLTEAVGLSEEDYRPMGIRGRELIMNNYSVEIVAQKMKQLYEDSMIEK
ncbi:glycosyl transferase family 1 [Bacteroidia bacterium]|nr:glycosyl transferase family 1 [Bacteroidia bacterium]